jgi:hypothetical protein
MFVSAVGPTCALPVINEQAKLELQGKDVTFLSPIRKVLISNLCPETS